MSQLLMLLAGALATSLLATGGWLLMRRRCGRGKPARELCGAVDRYLQRLRARQDAPFDPDALWKALEEVRRIQRASFPELYPELLEFTRAHAELTRLLLQEHMERHGVPTGWDGAGSEHKLQAPLQQLDAAARQLKLRCRGVAGLEADSQLPDSRLR